MTAGNLARHAVGRQPLNEQLSTHDEPETVNLDQRAVHVPGRARSSATRCARCARIDGPALEVSKTGFAASFILGGQIGTERPRLFQIYSEGNSSRRPTTRPIFQIGEHKYGKPILDRVARADMRLGEAAKLILLSFNSTCAPTCRSACRSTS